MARSKKRSPEVEEVRPYVEGVAKNLADKLWGPNGPKWGTQFTDIEDLVVAIRDVLSEKMLQCGLERQAATQVDERPPACQHCSGCGLVIPPDPEEPTEPRVLASISTLPDSPNKVRHLSGGLSAVSRVCRSMILVLIKCESYCQI